MNAFSTHTPQEPFDAPLFDRSPKGMPPAWARSMMQRWAGELRMENMRRGKLLSVRCLADMMEEAAEGYTEAAKQAADEAEANRERGA